MSDKKPSAFEGDTTYRLLVEAVRHWVISWFLASTKLPETAVFYVYSGGPNGIDWGNAPGPDDPGLKPLRYKRIKVTLEIESNQM